MTTAQKLNSLLDSMSIEELKSAAISYKDDVTNEGFIIGEKNKQPTFKKRCFQEVFAKFAEENLY